MNHVQRDLIHKRAERGAALLDRRRPGWFTDVDSSLLDVGDAECCVLGQVFGNYLAGVSRFGLAKNHDIDHVVASGCGFVASCDWLAEAVSIFEEYDVLTEAWRVLIEKRLANVGLLA